MKLVSTLNITLKPIKMKKRLFSTYLCAFILSMCLQAQDAPDVNFTDINGETHNLYSYLDMGYTVVFDFSYEFCGPCGQWSDNVGHQLWEDYGINGDNSIRMFYFDVMDDVSDADLQEYTQEWGIEYPVTNLLTYGLDDYPAESFPTLYYICPDKSFTKSVGYGYPGTELLVNQTIHACKGITIPDENVTLISAQPVESTSLCNTNPLQYKPYLYLASLSLMMEDYTADIFINDVFYSTLDVDPWADGIGASYDYPILDPIPVNYNDEITIVAHYPGDTYAEDDTLKVLMPSSVSTPSSTTASFVASWDDFKIRDSQGDYIDGLTNGQLEFDLEVGDCYSVQFYNAHLYSNTLEDADGNVMASVTMSYDNSSYTSPFYFHVRNGVEIDDYSFNSTLSRIEYFDVLGRTQPINAISEGIYFEVSYFTNGEKHIQKRYKTKTY